MAKYYAIGATMNYGAKGLEAKEAVLLGMIEAKNLTEARRIGFETYRDDWFTPEGGKQIAVVGKAGYKAYWEQLVNETKNEIYTLRMLLEDYKGFDYENGEIVVVNINNAIRAPYICKYVKGELKNTFHNMSNELDTQVWDWKHTEKTLVVTIG